MSSVKPLLLQSLKNAQTRLSARSEAHASLVERSADVLQRIEDLHALCEESASEVAEILQALHTLYGDDWEQDDEPEDPQEPEGS